MQCPDCKPLIDYLADNILPEDEQVARKTVFESEVYTLKDGVLYHIHEPRTKRRNLVTPVTTQLVVPTQLREEVLKGIHDQVGHPGFTKSYLLLRNTLFWKNAYADLFNWVRSCDVCLQCKHPKGPPAPLVPMPVAGQIMERVHLNHLGPLSTIPEGYKHVLTMI